MTKLDFLDGELELEFVQMELVANSLVFLLRHSGMSRTDIAHKLGWKKSRVSRVLSGDENLTIKTISQFVEALGYTFDVVFYNQNYLRPKQPWQIDNELVTIPKPKYLMQMQTADATRDDFKNENYGDCYIRVDQLNTETQASISMPTTMLESISIMGLGDTKSYINKELIRECR